MGWVARLRRKCGARDRHVHPTDTRARNERFAAVAATHETQVKSPATSAIEPHVNVVAVVGTREVPERERRLLGARVVVAVADEQVLVVARGGR
jgi:hypothetical protein